MSLRQLFAEATASAEASVLYPIPREAPSVASSSGAGSLNRRLRSLGILASDGGLDLIDTPTARRTKVKVLRK